MHSKPKIVKENKVVRLYNKRTPEVRKVLLEAADATHERHYTDVVVVTRSSEGISLWSTSGKRSIQMGMIEFAKHIIYNE